MLASVLETIAFVSSLKQDSNQLCPLMFQRGAVQEENRYVRDCKRLFVVDKSANDKKATQLPKLSGEALNDESLCSWSPVMLEWSLKGI